MQCTALESKTKKGAMGIIPKKIPSVGSKNAYRIRRNPQKERELTKMCIIKTNNINARHAWDYAKSHHTPNEYHPLTRSDTPNPMPSPCLHPITYEAYR